MNYFTALSAHLGSGIPLLLLQILVVLLASRTFAFIFRRAGQPAVVGEIFAGILLGPSLFGALLPGLHGFLFPPGSLHVLHSLAQIGLILFVFMIGMEFDLPAFRAHARPAVLISLSSIALPFVLGYLLAHQLHAELAPPGVSPVSFSLFIGVAMSVTAFPVLARIIQERELTRTTLGTLALVSAAIGDLAAWILLALIVAVVQASQLAYAGITLGLSAAFLVFMVMVVRPFLTRASSVYVSREIVGRGVMAVVLALLFASALFTEVVGIHALFGAFVAGVVMPANTKFRKIVSSRIEDLSVSFLLPLFFALTGLRTNLGFLLDTSVWTWFGAVLFVAVFGKFGAGAVASLASGLGLRNALAIGVLLNARGLMELVVLNIGFEIGVLSSEMFAMMVMMAVATTFMTGPFLTLVLQTARRRVRHAVVAAREGLRILTPFGPPEAGVALLRVASSLLPRARENSITAVHFAPASDFSIVDDPEREGKIFLQLARFGRENGIRFQPLYQSSSDVSIDIVRRAQEMQASWIIMGAARSVFGDNKIGGKVGEVLRSAPCGVGILVDNGLQALSAVQVIHARKRDDVLLDLAARMRVTRGTRITVVDLSDSGGTNGGRFLKILGRSSPRRPPPRITRVLDENPVELLNSDLLVMSVNHYLEMKYRNPRWLDECPASLLLIRPGWTEEEKSA